jgi:hypothetical protein
MMNYLLYVRDLAEYKKQLNHPDHVYGTLPMIPEMFSMLSLKEDELVLQPFEIKKDEAG